MYPYKQLLTLIASCIGLTLSAAGVPENITVTGAALLWRNPADIESRNLFFGPGDEAHEPRGPFTFIEEDLDGTNPKIAVRDPDGVKWKVKLGAEARPETAASRLTWAVGYFANEDYFVKNLEVRNMPQHLRRGQKLVGRDGLLHNVRLKRYLAGEKKVGNWAWLQDPFTGTRELNGLRVLMALMNNWDLTDENNAVYTEKDQPERIYMVSDLGSTFGTGTLTWPMRRARGDLACYRHSKFITSTTPAYVDFHTPAHPSFFFLFTPREYFSKLHIRWIGRHVPRQDARWMGELLGQLSPGQIRDAFRAAGYSQEEVDGFAAVVEQRIGELVKL